MTDLKLLALDSEDLEVISATTQDAVVRVGDMGFAKADQRFALLMNRFAWEEDDARGKGQRKRAALHFDRVTDVKVAGIDTNARDGVLELLAIRFTETDDARRARRTALCRRRHRAAHRRMPRGAAAGPRRRLGGQGAARARTRQGLTCRSASTAATPISPSSFETLLGSQARGLRGGRRDRRRDPRRRARARRRGGARLHRQVRPPAADARRRCASPTPRSTPPRRASPARCAPRCRPRTTASARTTKSRSRSTTSIRTRSASPSAPAGRRSRPSASTCPAASPPIRPRC